MEIILCVSFVTHGAFPHFPTPIRTRFFRVATSAGWHYVSVNRFTKVYLPSLSLRGLGASGST